MNVTGRYRSDLNVSIYEPVSLIHTRYTLALTDECAAMLGERTAAHCRE